MDKYLHFETSDFAEDDHFIRWVQERSAVDDKFWNKWIEEHPDKRDSISQAKKLVERLQFKNETKIEETRDRIWAGINQHVQNSSAPKPKPINKTLILKLFSLAAAAAVVAVLFWPAGAELIEVRTNETMTEVTLPDGSDVYLNRYSMLQYSENQWLEKREVKLSGEAFFDVEHGSSFKVSTDLGHVHVLGTEFNVSTRNAMLYVECESGKVSVRSQNEETVLNPSDAVTVQQGKHIPSKISIGKSRGKWRQGSYFYQNTSVKHVFEDLERVFDVELNYEEEINKMNYSGVFNDKNLESALREVCWPLNLSFTINNKSISIKRNK